MLQISPSATKKRLAPIWLHFNQGNVMSELLEMLRGLRDAERADEPRLSDEVVIMRLRERVAEMLAPNPWKPGDLVTIKRDVPIKGAAKPHVVVRSGDVELGRAFGESGNWTNGCLNNVQVACMQGDHIAPHIVPHWALEPYTAT